MALMLSVVAAAQEQNENDDVSDDLAQDQAAERGSDHSRDFPVLVDGQRFGMESTLPVTDLPMCAEFVEPCPESADETEETMVSVRDGKPVWRLDFYAAPGDGLEDPEVLSRLDAEADADIVKKGAEVETTHLFAGRLRIAKDGSMSVDAIMGKDRTNQSVTYGAGDVFWLAIDRPSDIPITGAPTTGCWIEVECRPETTETGGARDERR